LLGHPLDALVRCWEWDKISACQAYWNRHGQSCGNGDQHKCTTARRIFLTSLLQRWS